MMSSSTVVVLPNSTTVCYNATVFVNDQPIKVKSLKELNVSNQLRIGLPKGSLQEATLRMMRKAGFNVSVGDRSYSPYIDDPELNGILIRAQEIARYVQEGVLDCGITGKDWIMENGADVVEVASLIYAKQGLRPVRLVLAVHNDSDFQSVQDLQGKRIATELVNVTRSFLKEHGVEAHVEYSWGATEAKVGIGVDAIVELTETGRSLRANNLKIIDTICYSTTEFIANKKSWENPWKKDKIENLVLLVKGAIAAQEKVGLKMNVAEKDLKAVLKLLPAMKRPTISALAQEGWLDVDTIIDEKTARVLIPQLKKAGAQGIIEYPLNKAIY